MQDACATFKGVIFFSSSLSDLYFSPRRGCPRVLKFCMDFFLTQILGFWEDVWRWISSKRGARTRIFVSGNVQIFSFPSFNMTWQPNWSPMLCVTDARTDSVILEHELCVDVTDRQIDTRGHHLADTEANNTSGLRSQWKWLHLVVFWTIGKGSVKC